MIEPTTSTLGAYGLCLAGLPGAEPWMRPQLPGAPTMELRVEVGPPDDAPSRVDESSADLRLLNAGRLRAQRGHSTVRYVLPAVPPDEDLLHPYAAPAAALVWRWAGREAIHAGVVAVNGGAVLLLGGKGAGKSTTLAWLSQSAGAGVLADDLAVLDESGVLGGPRSIDLREPAATPVATSALVRGNSRSRLTVPATPDRLPLAGVAVLAWGPGTAVSPVPVEQRWDLIAAQRTYPTLPANPVSLLEVVAAPMYRFTRRAGLESVPDVGQAVLDTFA